MIDRLLSAFDLSTPFGVLVFLGAILSVFLAQISWHREVNRGDSGLLRNVRRAGYFLQALSFIWALDYGFKHQWEPWPPFVFIIAVMDVNMLVRIITIYVRGAAPERQRGSNGASLAR